MSDSPLAEFLDEYFAECDEHLTDARRSLLALEASIDQPQPERGPLDELFRNFHSLKGLSAMVGVGQAEALAHRLESYLSRLRKGEARLSSSALDALLAGAAALEQVIAAHRQQAASPDITAALAGIEALMQDQPAAERPMPALPVDKQPLLQAALAQGGRAWRIHFVPAPALAERGINVNTVRQRLQEAGSLIHAAPLTSRGQIAFTFVLVSKLDESVLSGWQADGLVCTPYEEAAVAPEKTVPRAPSLGTGNVVRVNLSRLDELMRRLGDLVISRSRLQEHLYRLGAVLPARERRGLEEINQAMERQLRDLRAGVMQVRMVPIGEIFARMQLVVRDLARDSGKEINLVLRGAETELDKYLVERMADPLLHLVRNAVSHGLETPAERAAAGKPLAGRLELRATASGDTVLLEVADDGRGIQTTQVLARARATGLALAEDIQPDDLLELLCTAGFSTRAEADRASGRGIGMDVVRSAVEQLGGVLSLKTQPGAGTTFAIRLPLTLAIADALIVAVAAQTYAVPQVAVREVIEIQPAAVTVLENNEILSHRGLVVPLVRLSRLFRLNGAGQARHALVVGEGTHALALAVDRILGLREMVVRALTDPLVQVPGINGATELGDGRVVLILDTASLTRARRGPLPELAPGRHTAKHNKGTYE